MAGCYCVWCCLLCAKLNLCKSGSVSARCFQKSEILPLTQRRYREIKANIAKLDMCGSSIASRRAHAECVKLGIKLRIPTPPDTK